MRLRNKSWCRRARFQLVLFAYLHLVGKDKDAIAKELKAAFKVNEAQAEKITPRITGRVRLYQRVLELVPAKA